MKYKEVLKEIDKHTWWSEEAPGVVQMLVYPLHCFITQSTVLHPKFLTIAIIGFKGRHFYERSPEDEKHLVYKYIFKRMNKDKNYLNIIIKDTRRKARIFLKEAFNFVKNKDRMNNRDLHRSYVNFMNKYLNYLPYPAGIECIDIPTTYYLESMIQKELPKLPARELNNILLVLSSPKKLSFIEEERIDFLKLCLANYNDIRNNKLTSKLKKQLDNHSKKYFYVLNNYKDVRFLDSNYFFKKSREELKKNKIKLQSELKSLKNKIKNLKKKEREIYKQYKLSADLKLHLKITEIIGESIDERKDTMLQANHYIELYCKEIAKRFNIDIWDIKDYTFEEIQQLLLDNKKADKNLLKKRGKFAAYVMKHKNKGKVEAKWFYGKQAEVILKKTSYTLSEEIKGQVASAPVKKISGKVQVILDVSKQKFKEGNILVTTMTRPEFVPLMRKAKAIITDEGGITCHAAIVSRELGIPCIIGTKIATKILKNKDLVEVNTDKGVVRKIK